MYLRRYCPSCGCPGSWCIAMMTEPAARNSSALKNACVIRWKIAGGVGRGAQRHGHVAELGQGRIGHHPLDVVLHDAPARPMNSAVMAPMTMTTCERGGREQLEQRRHARHHEDAGGHHGGGVDQAEIGVGPSIESGSQTCSGTCADLPMAPMNNRMQAWLITDQSTPGKHLHGGCPPWPRLRRRTRWRNPDCRASRYTSARRRCRAEKPKSPTRLTRKAFRLA